MAISSISTNISAYFAQNNLSRAADSTSSSISRLSSGQRIVRAADDVAGLSVGTILRTSVNTLKTAVKNAQQASSLLQVADGGLANITEILQRQKALATQATSGSLSASERGYLNQEFQNLTNEIDRLVDNTKFNKVVLLDGSLSGSKSNELASLDADVSGNITGVNGSAAGATSLEFFRLDPAGGFSSLVGVMEFVDSATPPVALADDQFTTLPSNLSGAVSDITLKSVDYGVSASLEVTIGGTVFSGTVLGDGTATDFVLENGSTRILFTPVTGLDFSDQATTQATMIGLNSLADYGQVELSRTMFVAGFNPDDAGLVGADASPVLRMSDTSDMSIKNFAYVGGATGANVLQVEVGGRTFTAIDVADDPAAAIIEFVNGNDVLAVDLTAMTSTFDLFLQPNGNDREAFVNALNKAFTNAQGSISFQTGSVVTDKIDVGIRSVRTSTLFGGSINISSTSDAVAAGDILDAAISYVTSVRADVGALQSRFDYAMANLETTIQNQDAARSLFLDADISEESTNFANNQVLQQASISVLAQANQLPQNLLKLIG